MDHDFIPPVFLQRLLAPVPVPSAGMQKYTRRQCYGYVGEQTALKYEGSYRYSKEKFVAALKIQN